MAEVKICGLSTPETMAAALNAGADYVGLVFFAKSPRNISLQKARELAGLARNKSRIVALTVDADDELLSSIAREVKPDYIQAHGGESSERVAAITAATGIAVIKALKLAEKADLAAGEMYTEAAAMLLYDAKPPPDMKNALPGGNGLRFDWRLLEGVSAERTYMLSGGLDASNVADAIAATNAPIVDVSSGVESAPGVKDERLIAQFIAAARRASDRQSA